MYLIKLSFICIILPKLEVEEPRQRKVKLGTLMLGQKVKKQVVLVNRSTLDLSFTLLLNTNKALDPKVGNSNTMIIIGSHTGNTYCISSPYLSSPLLSSSLLSSTLLLQDLSFSPAGELNLKASGGSCDVEIQFSPHQHIPPFKAELQAEFAGLLHPLLTIHGCCQVVCEVHFLLFYEAGSSDACIWLL